MRHIAWRSPRACAMLGPGTGSTSNWNRIHKRERFLKMKRLYWLLLLALGTLLLVWGCTQPAAPGRTINPGAGGSGSVTTCSAPLTKCGEACVDLTTNAANCGACGTSCAAGMTCAGSTCACQAGLSNCSGACVNVAMDTRNC